MLPLARPVEDGSKVIDPSVVVSNASVSLAAGASRKHIAAVNDELAFGLGMGKVADNVHHVVERM